MKEAAAPSKAEGAIRGLERIKADFQMRGANATTIERAISTIRQAADHIETLEARVATLSAALEPFAKLSAMPEMRVLKSETDINLEGEGGRVRPKFDLNKALRAAKEAKR
ncbi:hypothetical protein [Mesorhizobium sp. M0058]|uniref:hypothetical protein n=1 Tax=Mesorhizobium sp. M0058 TaxID=2956865 RepID=UPI003337D7F6